MANCPHCTDGRIYYCQRHRMSDGCDCRLEWEPCPTCGGSDEVEEEDDEV